MGVDVSPQRWQAVPPAFYSPATGVWRRWDDTDIGLSASQVVLAGAWGMQDVVVAPPPPPPPPLPGTEWVYVLNDDFTGWSTPIGGIPTAAEWNSRLGMGTNNTGSNTSQKVSAGQAALDQYVRIVDGGSGGGVTNRGKVLSFLLPANSGSSNKGAQLWCNMPNPQDCDECILEYDLRFRGATPDLPFGPEWGYGGKLLGMGGVVRGTGPGQPSGCKTPDDVGWSGRQMWWGKNATGKAPYSAVGSRKNLGLYYSYDWKRVDQCGDNLAYKTPTTSTDSFRDQTWHSLRIHYRLNTPGLADGFMQVMLDGVEVRVVYNWQPRTRADLHITHLWMHIFRGGNDTTWGVSRNTRIDIDRLRISRPVAA